MKDQNKTGRIASLIGAVSGGALITYSLSELLPHGLWLYLFLLVFGVVIVTNKINAIIRES